MKKTIAFISGLSVLYYVLCTSCDPAFSTRVYLTNKTGNTIYLKNTAKKGYYKMGLGSVGVVDTPNIRGGNTYAHLPVLIKPDSSRLIYSFEKWGVSRGAKIQDLAHIKADSIVLSCSGKDFLVKLYDSTRCKQSIIKGEYSVEVYRMIGADELK